MLPSLSFPPQCCFGTSPIQAEKFRPERKAFGSATLATRAVASAGPMPGIASSRLLVSLERCLARIRCSNSRICAFKARSCAPRAARHAVQPQARDSHWRSQRQQAVVQHLCVPPGQRSRARPDGRDRVDHRGLLANEELAGAMEHQAALLLGRLGLHKPHVGPGDRLTDDLGVSGIVLLPLDVGLYISGGIRRTVWPSA
jgi:hypothetical protein